MPRRDLYHDIVRNALIKEGWTITHDPLILGNLELRVYPDLGAEKKQSDRHSMTVAIEIKVFGSIGQISELEKAIGQYILYRSILHRSGSARQPYLAISSTIYQQLFQKTIIQNLIEDEKIHLLIFNPNLEEIEQWID
ncbi:element excision factor XisH family protein [Roseofilum sp. BLCC_M154]|uniref:Element excision factor XisH family protein n=1 Tax=Roseofilum acuticapitatum BLCC-M154 TaxID=3022444 RepID=A0ABT7AT53_9CYAN|nr:element excision factor XisH family protein [Roseofilum acuticapitatum]MDJ1170085.1 element excision factor XisH family protein [Roseofilum acuticapitatum BLCC-M154]